MKLKGKPHENNSKTNSKTSGFTLIELMLVISIIAILAALLLPALKKAKETAYSIQCVARNKQLLIAVSSFADDNRYYPQYRSASSDPSSNNYHPLHDKYDYNWWGGVLAHYLSDKPFAYGSDTNWSEWHLCPVQPTDRMRDWIAYNIWFGYAAANTTSGVQYRIHRQVRPGDVYKPSETSMFGDRKNTTVDRFYYYGAGGDPDWYHHGRSAVFGFADGHAELLPGSIASNLFTIDQTVRTYFKYPKKW